MNKKIIAPICTAVAMLGLAVGSTFALFTDKGSADINVLAGQVKIDYSMTLDVAESRYLDLPPYDAVVAAEGSDFDAIFENGGTAKVLATEDSLNLKLDRLAPMDMIAVTAKATNLSDINIRHRYSIVLDGELVPALQVVVDGTDYSTADTHLEFTSCWSSVASPDVEQLCQKDIRVYFPYGGDEQNFYQGKECDIKVSVEAIQGNAHVEDPEDEDIEIPEYEEIHGEKPSTEEKFTYMFNSNGTVSTKTSGKSVAPETEELILNVENTGTPVVDVPTGKDFLALDVEELGLKTDNDVAVEVGVKIGSGKEGVEVYHDGTLIDSTYDTDNGLVNFETKSFSPFDILFDASSMSFIKSVQDLINYRDAWNAGLETRPMVLKADLDISEIVWAPLGTWQNPYYGSIDGNGYKITGLSNNGKSVEEIDLETFVTTTTGTYGAAYGLVGVAGSKLENQNLVIKNLILDNVSVNLTDGNCIGGAIGYAPETGDFNSKAGQVGAGNFSLNNVEIDNVDVTGTMIGTDCASGIMGKAYNPGSLVIKNCETDVYVESTNGRAAGIVGYASLPSSYNIVNNSVVNDVKATKNAVDGIAIGTNVGSDYVIDHNTFTGDLYWKGTLVEEDTERVITYVYEDDVCTSVILSQPSNKAWEQKTVVGIGSNVLMTGEFYAIDALPINGDNVQIKDCVVSGGGFTIYGNVTTENSDFTAITPIVGHKTGPSATFTIIDGTFNCLQVYINSTLNIKGGTFNGASKTIRVRNESSLSLPFHINIEGGRYKLVNPISVDAAAQGLEDINYIGGHISNVADEFGYYNFIAD